MEEDILGEEVRKVLLSDVINTIIIVLVSYFI